MKKWLDGLYGKSELYFALLWIGVYCVGGSLANPLSQMTGVDSSVHMVFHVVLTGLLFGWIKKNRLLTYYGLGKPAVTAARFLWYIPLVVFVSHNLWLGVGINLPLLDTVCYLVSMFCVGFLEEVIFRGFLFRAIARENRTTAIIVSSVTFGVGHIINLFNGSGMELVANACQVVGAVACGFLLVVLFARGGSLIPCILAHSANNMVSVFANETGVTVSQKLVLSGINLVIVVVYTLVLTKRLPKGALYEKV